MLPGMSTAVPLPAPERAARWLLAASWGTTLLCLALICVNLWEGPYAGVLAPAVAGVGLSLASIGRLKRRAASPLLVVAGVACMLLALWFRQQHLEQRWQAAVRETAQRASIDAFEAQVRALIDRQRQELDALKAGADEWDDATRERVRKLELNFATAARDAEQLISEQRRQLERSAAPPASERSPE